MGIRSRCRDCDNAGTRDYQRRTPERQACRQKHWRAANPDRWHAIAKTHRDTHPLEERLRRGRLRAERAGVVAKHITADELIADWERRGIDPARCVYTWEPLQDGWHIDHAVPLSQPNTPGHVVNNLVPCNQRANVAKWRRHWIDYLADRSEAATRSSQG
ncbi:hypothetical protein OG976_04745 [Mycobacterium sp. NBC_00419]|uniref:hypothetical protein n=1 Tax=Mycobacterium sp. NBC_00419 TaxID=2975989 RepID=UPI002E1CE97F